MIKKYLYGGPGYFLPKNNLLLKFKDKLYNLSRRIMATANNVKDINYDTLPNGEPLEGVAQTTYLLPRHLQKEKFLEYGYKESPGDYGLVKKAVGNRKLPVYQKNPDVISRNKLQVVGNPDYTVWFGNSTEALTHAGNYPSAIYHDDLGNLYQKSWDLNDYGGGAGAYTHYSPKEKIMADIGDIIGSPVVVTTGFRPIYTLKGPEDKLANLLDTGEWKPLDNIINSYLNKKGLHIDSYKENGNNIKFLSLPEVIIKGKKQNIKMRSSIKAANARKWKHLMGGSLNYAEWEQMTPELKLTYRTNRAKAYINENLSIGNLWNATKTYLGGNDPENPNLNQMIVDVPLPGKVNMSLYKDAKTVLKGALFNNERFVDFVNKLVGRKINPKNIGIKKTPNFDFVDLQSETVPKGFVKGNEITFNNVKLPLTGLTVRKAKPINLINPITTKAELLAAMDYNSAVNPSQRVNTSLPTGRPSIKMLDADGNLIDIRYPKKPVLPTISLTTIIKDNKLANLTSHERYLLKRDFTKKLRTTDKYARAFNSGDNRPLNSGLSKMKHMQDEHDWQLMRSYHPYKSQIEKWELKMAKALAKGNSEQIKLLNKLRKGLIEEYRKLFRFKNGGTLIEILGLGGDISNIFKNVGSWALDNKDLINGVGGALVSGIGLFKNSSASADFRDSDNKRIQEGYNAIVNDLGDGIDEEVNSLIAQMKEQNPDLNFGEIDYLMLRLKVEQLRRLKNMLKADMYKLYELEKQGEVLSSMEESNTSLLGGLLSKLGGIGTDVLNSKSASATKGTATGSTVGTTGTTTYVGTNGSLRLNNMLA